MSRHRNVRSMNYDEYDDEDVYGHSVDDDYSISPTDAQQWLFDRARGQSSIANFLSNNDDIEEEDEEAENERYAKSRRDSENFQMPKLEEVDQAKLASCLEEVRNVVGDVVSDRVIVEASMKFGFDITKVLDEILNECSSKTAEPTVPPTVKITSVPVPVASSTAVPAAKLFAQQKSPIGSGRNTPDPEAITSPADDTVKTYKVSKEQAQRDAKQIFQSERGEDKAHFQMICIGHVDAGKSTLMGHLLVDMGNVSQKTMHKYEQESKKIGKQSFMYAWVLDETGEERTRGITMDVGSSRIVTKTKIITLLDAPGHKDFIPNMISGATQADVALLVIDATRGEFESGFESGGQTREHAILVRSLGVNQLGVVINKLDTVNWSEERFNEIVGKLKTFLKQAGYKESDVTYIPCSGLTGENLTKPATEPQLISWYKGPHLLEVIENFKIPERAIDRPFRMSVSDLFKGTGAGVCVNGRIDTGILCVNDKVLVGPNREQAQVKGISIDEVSQNNAFSGDQVSVTLIGMDQNNINVGHLVYDPLFPVPVTTRFQARLLVFNVKVPITIGFPVILHYQSLVEPATITKLTAQIHKGTGEVLKKKPRFLENNSCALLEIETTKPICIEKYGDFKELGRFMLRVGGVTIAAGVVTKIR